MGDVDWHVRVDVEGALILVRYFFLDNPIPIFFWDSFFFVDGEGALRVVRLKKNEINFFFNLTDLSAR